MAILDFLKKYFKNKNNDVNKLIKISDSFVMPTRELFKDNPQMVDMIESYKAEYKKVLSDKKLLFSMDLTNSVNENIRMYSELIANIFIDEGIIEGRLDTKIKMFYKVNKLNLYSDEISRLHVECTARLVALLEIFNERKIFMSKHKKDALLFAINNLTNALVVFEAQRGAIRVERENYLNNYAMIDTRDTPEYEQKREGFIQEKVKILNRVLPFLGKNLDSYNLSDMLILEKELEIYVYNNKADVEAIQEKISKLDTHVDYEDSSHKIYEIDEILKLEKQALIFYYFGKNLINFEELYKIYECKLMCLIEMSDHRFTQSIKSALSLEYDCYTKICQKRFEDIRNGRNPVINVLFKDDSHEAIKWVVEQCSYGRTPGLILVGPSAYDAKFVCSFDYVDGFIKYLENELVIIKEENLILGSFEKENESNENIFIVSAEIPKSSLSILESIFTWDESIPKISLYELMRLYDRNYATLFGVSYFDEGVYNLYKLYQENLSYYNLPEGIKKIEFNKSIEDEEITNDEGDLIINVDELIRKHFINQLVENAKGKQLVLPDSLEVFHRRLFPANTIADVVLNNNIKSVSMSLLENVAENLIIPSSLENIVDDIERALPRKYSHVFERSELDDKWSILNRTGFKTLESVTFADFENSKLLKNKESLRLLFANTLYIDSKTKEAQLKTKIKNITFIDEKSDIIYTIDISDLSFPIRPNELLKDAFCEAIWSHDIYCFMMHIEQQILKRLKVEKTLINHSLS